MAKKPVISLSSAPHEWQATSRVMRTNSSFKWRIENFSQCPFSGHDEIQSPSFSCSSSTWVLSVYPNGINDKNAGSISLFLSKLSPDAEKNVKYKMCFKDMKGSNYFERKAEAIYGSEKLGWNCFINRELLLQERYAQLLPEDVLTVYCEISMFENTAHGEAERIHQGMIAISNESAKFNSLDVMSNDFSALRKSGRNCDVTFSVGKEEFQAHKLILETRSRVFAAMFQHDMREARHSVVTVTDIESSVFDTLLDYVYSGSVIHITAENARGLYLAADKYNLEALKRKCMQILLNRVSVDTFCELAILADMHSDKEMLDSLKNFAFCNFFAIIHTKYWEDLTQENPRLATEVIRAATKHLNRKNNEDT